ncbi:MAG: helix-turn-helix domain-containing protein [Actinobacteria bacterium]|nr:helix-turn-helix domain-containing protein [Actinomycetota bacterium]
MAATIPLSVAEASQQWNVPKRTIQHAIATGGLKAHKMPGRTGAYLIAERDLNKWIAKRVTKASA